MTTEFTSLSPSGTPGTLYGDFSLKSAEIFEVAEAVHPVVSDKATIAQVHRLGVLGSVYPTYSEIVAFAQRHNLTVAEAAHLIYVDSPKLVKNLFPGDAAHLTTSDGLEITQEHLVGTQEAAHLTVSDAIRIIQEHGLAVDDSAHVHVADQSHLNIRIPFYPAPARRTLDIGIHPRVLELDTALRVLDVCSEERAFLIEAALRLVEISPYPRVYTVESETREISVGPDPRTNKRTTTWRQ